MCKMCGLELTEQEWKILRQRFRYSKKQSVVARELGITGRTLTNHSNTIYHKIGVGGSELTPEKKQLAAQTYYWWHALRAEEVGGSELTPEEKQQAEESASGWAALRAEGLLGGNKTTLEGEEEIEHLMISKTEIRDKDDLPTAKTETMPATRTIEVSKATKRWLRYLWPTIFILLVVVVGGLLVYGLRPPPVIPLQPEYFLIQSSDDDLKDEFLLDLRYVPLSGLPTKANNEGVDLRKYSLEITFSGAEGRRAQLWYKDNNWKSVYSKEYIVSAQPICYNPFRDGRDRDEFRDFSNIYAVGAKIDSGTEGVQIVSAKLVPQCAQNKGE